MDDTIEEVLEAADLDLDPEKIDEAQQYEEELEVDGEELEVETTRFVYVDVYIPDSESTSETSNITEKVILEDNRMFQIEVERLPECPIHKGIIEAGEEAVRQCSDCGIMMCRMCTQECRDCKKHLCRNCWSAQEKEVYLCSSHAP